MQPLPDITLIGFLDWMDVNRNAHIPPDQTLEEFVLDYGNRKEMERLAKRYLNRYPATPEGRLERDLDMALAAAKRACMQQFQQDAQWLSNPNAYEYFVERYLIPASQSAVERSLLDNLELHRVVHDVSPRALVSSIQNKLEWEQSSQVEEYISSLDGTSARAVREFIGFLKQQTDASDENDNIPASVIRKLIRQYADKRYFADGLTLSERDKLRSTLERAFFDDRSKSPYFKRITSMRGTSVRYYDRTARFKCVFLAEGREFYELVKSHWLELNDYTGNHLDVFYDPDELLVKGCREADKLSVRGRVTSYPSIYLWHASLKEGQGIPVGPISDCVDDILSLVKTVVDDIADGTSFEDVVVNARLRVERYDRVAHESQKVEAQFLDSLSHSCAQLQANPDVYGSATENQRNTQIRDLLSALFLRPFELNGRSFQFGVLDQTLRGRSRSGKSAGELDLLVTLNGLSYAVIEGLNIPSTKEGIHWNRTYLKEHVRRLGGYDHNGLRRNVILVYASSDDMDGFFRSLLNEILNCKGYSVKDDALYDIMDATDSLCDLANMRVVSAKYHYNGTERSLYFFVVGMESAAMG